MENTLIYLTGYPASGKLTITKLLCEKTDALLIDNHTINNPIIQLIRKSGGERLGDPVWTETAKVRKIVLDAMITLGAPEASYVMPNALINKKGHKELFEQIMNTAERRKAKFIPIKLTCMPDDLLKRVSSAERQEHKKLTDVKKLKSIIKKYKPLDFQHKNAFEINTSKLSPEENVQRIIEHTKIV